MKCGALALAAALATLAGPARAMSAEHPLAMGARNTPVGRVLIANDDALVTVELVADAGYGLAAAHVCVAPAPFPWTAPGQCPYKVTLPPGTTRHTLAIPRAGVGATCGSELELQVHAEVGDRGGRGLGGAYAGAFKGHVGFTVHCCGNDTCEAAGGETASSCPADCAWGPAGTPLPRGAELVGADEFWRLAGEDGFDVVSSRTLDYGIATGSARTAAARALVDGLAAANPALKRLVPVEPQETAWLKRLGDGNYDLRLGGRGEATSVMLHGTDWQYREVAESLVRTPSRANQEALFLSLIDGIPADQRSGLPTAKTLSTLDDLALARANREVVRRVEQLVPNEALLVDDGHADDGPARFVMNSHDPGPDPQSGCEHEPGSVYRDFNWPLKAYTTKVRSQGRRGSCVAFAITAALETRLWKSKGLSTNYSEQELYAMAKGYWFPTSNAYGDGLSNDSVLDVLKDRDFELDAEVDWRYNPSWERIDDEDEEEYRDSCVDYDGFCSDTNHQLKIICTSLPPYSCAKARPWAVAGNGHHPVRLTGYVSLWNWLEPENSLATVRAQLNMGRPVVMGLQVDNWFKGAAETEGDLAGVVTVGSGGDGVGGHAVEVVGYINNGQIPFDSDLVDGAGGGYLIIKNSWGCGSGDGGYMYLSYDWVEDQAHGAYAVSSVASSVVSPSVSLAVNKSVLAAPGEVRVSATVNPATTRLLVYRGLGDDDVILEKNLAGGSEAVRSVDVEFESSSENGVQLFWALGKDQFGNKTSSNIVGVLVKIDDADPQVQLSAASSTVLAPGSVTLQATASDNVGVTRVRFFRGLSLIGEDTVKPWAISQAVGIGDVGPSPYLALAYDAAGNVAMSNVIEVTVVAAPKPLVQSFTASTTSLPAGGGQVTLAWNVSGASTVNLAPGPGAVAAQGKATVNVSQTTTFVLSAKNAAGSTSTATVVVTVPIQLPPVIRSFQASPASLPEGGGDTTLQWDVLGSGVTLSLEPGPGNVTGLTSTTVPVAKTTTWLLVASNAAGVTRSAVTVEVGAPPPPR
jgi:hypothetical protein